MLYQLSIRDIRTYSYAAIFTLGNILVPQLCHLIPNGGLILLPIYFFTLIAAYKYGIVAGLVTAICSPLINHILFGMPALPVLPILLIKSGLLACFAAAMAHYVRDVKLWAIALVVIAYQAAGFLFEWPMTGSMQMALQDIRMGYPGIILQIIGGYALLKLIIKK